MPKKLHIWSFYEYYENYESGSTPDIGMSPCVSFWFSWPRSQISFAVWYPALSSCQTSEVTDRRWIWTEQIELCLSRLFLTRYRRICLFFVEVEYLGTVEDSKFDTWKLLLDSKHILCEDPLTFLSEHTSDLVKQAEITDDCSPEVNKLRLMGICFLEN